LAAWFSLALDVPLVPMFFSFFVPHPKADHRDCHAVNTPLLGEPSLDSPLRKQQGAWTDTEFRPKPEQ
jgi:hypothetical protein